MTRSPNPVKFSQALEVVTEYFGTFVWEGRWGGGGRGHLQLLRTYKIGKHANTYKKLDAGQIAVG